MSNEEYLADMFQLFQDGDAEKREWIIDKLRAEGFDEEAINLELKAEEEGLNYHNDDILNRIDESRGK